MPSSQSTLRWRGTTFARCSHGIEPRLRSLRRLLPCTDAAVGSLSPQDVAAATSAESFSHPGGPATFVAASPDRPSVNELRRDCQAAPNVTLLPYDHLLRPGGGGAEPWER